MKYLSLNYIDNIIIILVTYFFIPSILIKKFLKPKYKNKGNSHILLIQLAKIGDLICTTPVFREIKNKYPKSKITLLCLYYTKGIVINNLNIDRIITINPSSYKSIQIYNIIKELKDSIFDISISFENGIINFSLPYLLSVDKRISTITKNETKSERLLERFVSHKLEYKQGEMASRHYLELLRFININNISNELPEVFFTKETELKVISWLNNNQTLKNNNYIGIAISAGNKLKQFDITKFAQLSNIIIEKYNYNIIMIGSKDDQYLAQQMQQMMKYKAINSCGIFTLEELPALIKQLKVFIGTDTGPVYIAGALNVPLIEIAGPSDLNTQKPSGNKSIFIKKELSCYPCSFIMNAPRICKTGHHRCIKDVTVEEIYEKFKLII